MNSETDFVSFDKIHRACSEHQNKIKNTEKGFIWHAGL